MELVFSGEAGPVEQEQIEGSVRSRRQQRDCVSDFQTKAGKRFLSAVYMAGISCWRTKMSLQWQGGEEKEGPIGDFDATYSFSNVYYKCGQAFMIVS